MEYLILGMIVLGGTFQMASTLNITVCDCGKAEIKGLIDIQQPLYCNKNLKKVNPIISEYEFY